jgi:hypothetical protein
MSDYKSLCQEFVKEMEAGWGYTIYSCNMLDIYSRALKALNRKPKSKAKTSTLAGYMNYSLSHSTRGDQS